MNQKAVNEVLGGLRLEQHPGKTFIGRIERGFYFLGRHFSRAGLTAAKATIEKFVERAARLYEQEPGEALASTRVGLDVRRCVAWADTGFGGAMNSAVPAIAPPRQPSKIASAS